MYLTGGQYKGRKIEVPTNVKPTLSKVRQGVFNMLNQYEYNSFLDMFAGSGLMGLEAISRGYSVKEIEQNPKNAAIIKKNYQNINLKADITIIDALKYKDSSKYDVIYIDPPWDMDYEKIIKKAQDLLEKDGIIVVEFDEQRHFDIQNILDNINSPLNVVKAKKYGRCLISLVG